MEKKKLFLTVWWQRVNTEDGLNYELAIGKHSNERGCSAGPMGEPCQHSAPQGLPQVQVSVQREPQLYQVTLGKQPFTKWSTPHQQPCLPFGGPEDTAPFLASCQNPYPNLLLRKPQTIPSWRPFYTVPGQCSSEVSREANKDWGTVPDYRIIGDEGGVTTECRM